MRIACEIVMLAGKRKFSTKPRFASKYLYPLPTENFLLSFSNDHIHGKYDRTSCDLRQGRRYLLMYFRSIKHIKSCISVKMVSHLELFGFLDLCFQHSGIKPWEAKANNIYTATNFS